MAPASASKASRQSLGPKSKSWRAVLQERQEKQLEAIPLHPDLSGSPAGALESRSGVEGREAGASPVREGSPLARLSSVLSDREQVREVDAEVIEGICRRFNAECETVRSMVLTEVTMLMDTIVSAEVKVTLSQLADLRKNANSHRPRKRLPAPGQASEESFETNADSRVSEDAAADPLKRAIEEMCQKRKREGLATNVIAPFQPYQKIITQDMRQKFNALARLAKIFANDLQTSVRDMKFPERAQAQREREELVAMYEEELSIMRAASDVAVKDAEYKAARECKEQLDALRRQHEEERKELQHRRDKHEKEVERKARKKVSAQIEDLEERLEVATRRLRDGDYDVRRRCYALEEEIGRSKQSNEVLVKQISDLDFESVKLKKALAHAREDSKALQSEEDEMSKTMHIAEKEKERFEILFKKEQRARAIATDNHTTMEAKLNQISVDFKSCDR